MSFHPSAPKPSAPPPAATNDDRKKVTLRLTTRQWKQLKQATVDEDKTIQDLLISALADKLEKFDV